MFGISVQRTPPAGFADFAPIAHLYSSTIFTSSCSVGVTGGGGCLNAASASWSLIDVTPAASVTPGQFGRAEGIPFNTDATLTMQCTGFGCPANNPTFTGTIHFTPTNISITNFK